MRSSRRHDLDGVRRQFEAWRAEGRQRRIPEPLWRAAVGLLDRYPTSVICRKLVLNPSRFKQVREVFSERETEPGRERRRKRWKGGLTDAPMPRGRRGGSVPASGSIRPAFVELTTVRAAAAAAQISPHSLEAGRTAAECRLVMENSSGARFTVILARTDVAVIEAVCRSLLGAELVVHHGAPAVM